MNSPEIYVQIAEGYERCVAGNSSESEWRYILFGAWPASLLALTATQTPWLFLVNKFESSVSVSVFIISYISASIIIIL